MTSSKPPKITVDEIKAARVAFESQEPRNLFYRVATELVDLALREQTSLSVAECLAVLLQTWNQAYYRYSKFDGAHFSSIERPLSAHAELLARYRIRSIATIDSAGREDLISLFDCFDRVLGPVGAAKSLHLLASDLFPLWDRAIASAYGLGLTNRGNNGEKYWTFLLIAKKQYGDLSAEDPVRGVYAAAGDDCRAQDKNKFR